MGIFGRKREDDSSDKLTKELTIINRLGLHARPSAKFVKICSRFRCDVWVEKDEERVNGKSIMGLMMLAAGQGSVLKVSCEGADAEKAMAEIEGLVNGKFDED